MRRPFLRTIKAKMASVIVFIVVILGILILLLSVGFYRNYRKLLLHEVRSLLLLEKERTDKDILRLETSVRQLAATGELLHQAARDNDFDALGRNAVVVSARINAPAIGGGVWFEPWSVYPDRERAAFYAHVDNGRVRYDPDFTSKEYDYPAQPWYASIREQLAQPGRDVAWTPPYFDDTGAKALMTTAGCLIPGEAGECIGMATVDWRLEDISQNIEDIRPTPGSFVLFADVKHDFILADSDPENGESQRGQPLSSVPWFRKDAPDTGRLEYRGTKYHSLRIAFDNGMLLVVNIPVSELERDLNRALTRLVLLLAGFGLLLTAVLHAMLARFINRPVAYLMKKADEVGNGNLDTRISLPSGDELGRLADTLGIMAGNLKTRIGELKTVTAEKERIGAELDIARNIQAAMLPSIFPPYPDRDEFDIVAAMIPAKEVGGDFYDFFLIDDNRVAVVVADVSGKGVPAALFMVVAKTLIRNHAKMGLPATEVFERVNAQLCENNNVGMFVTAFMGVLDIATGEFEYVNAGHNPPILFSGDAPGLLAVKPGFVLGGLPNIGYTSGRTTLLPGDGIFLYTDGITEAENGAGGEFGKERLLACAAAWRKDGRNNAGRLIDMVKNGVDDFAAGAPQFDDITMLCLSYFGQGSKRRTAVVANAENLPRVIGALDEALDSAGCDAKTRMRLQLAVEEVFVNIVHYAFPEGSGDVVFETEIRDVPRRVVLRFVDAGIPFNPLEKEEPDVELPAGEREIGGLGIFLVRKNVDHMEYERKDGRNVLTMTKTL